MSIPLSGTGERVMEDMLIVHRLTEGFEGDGRRYTYLLSSGLEFCLPLGMGRSVLVLLAGWWVWIGSYVVEICLTSPSSFILTHFDP